MRILITHPYCWPYVRRGSERFLAELSGYMALRGHDVTVLSTSPVGDEREVVSGVHIVRKRQIPVHRYAAPFARPESTFSKVCEDFLACHRFDLIHCLYHSDVLGAQKSAPSTPCIFHLTGVPFGRWIRRYPLETRIVRNAIRHASRILVVSQYAARRYEMAFANLQKPALVLPIPSYTKSFTAEQQHSRELTKPVILFMGALDEPRKGALPLAKAFNLVKEDVPDARLRYCGRDSVQIQSGILAAVDPRYRGDVQFLGSGKLDDLPAIYAAAAVTVLPSVEESFGMVLVESLASGTPVVSSSEIGSADVVTPATGRVFAALQKGKAMTNIRGLAQSIKDVVDLQRNSDLPLQCRAAVRRFDWNFVGRDYERLYEECAPAEKDARRRAKV